MWFVWFVVAREARQVCPDRIFLGAATIGGEAWLMRPPKKSETLEVRLPYPTKQAFMARGRDDGRSASEAVRGFIEAEVGAGRLARRRRGLIARVAAGAVLAAAAGAVAAPTLAHTNRGEAFERLDTNHDGVLSRAEYLNR